MELCLQWGWMFRENIGYYQSQVVPIDDTEFVLSTLWSRINPNDEYFMWKGMNDFRLIKFDGKLLQTEELNRMHEACIEFILKSIEESIAAHIVMLTHYQPTIRVIAPQHMDSVLNRAFVCEYGDLIAHSRIDV